MFPCNIDVIVSYENQNMKMSQLNHTSVETEDLDAWERSNGADEKGDHVCERGDGDADGGVGEGVGHPLRHRVLQLRTAPRCQHHKRVVYTNTCK